MTWANVTASFQCNNSLILRDANPSFIGGNAYKCCGVEKPSPGAPSAASAPPQWAYFMNCWTKKAASLGFSLWPPAQDTWMKTGRLGLQSPQGLLMFDAPGTKNQK